MKTKLLEDPKDLIKETDWIKFRGKCIAEGKTLAEKFNEFIKKEVK